LEISLQDTFSSVHFFTNESSVSKYLMGFSPE
jgi:hypothetical protein